MQETEIKINNSRINKSFSNENIFKIIAENSPDIVFIYNIEVRNEFGYINPSVRDKLGYSPQEFYEDPELWKKIICDDSLDFTTRLYNDQYDFSNPIELRCLKRDGKYIWLEELLSPIYDNNRKLVAIEGILRDITGRKKAEQQLTYLSFHDSLTSLYNRAYFEEEIKRLDTKRQLPLSVIIGDINGLKLINDAFGHSEGDKILKQSARALKKCCRAEDMVARWGGDEFSMLLPKTDIEEAHDVIKRIKNTCDKAKGNKIPLSLSLGAATKKEAEQNLKDIIKVAEENMYRQKLLETKSIIGTIIKSLERTLFEKSIKTEDHVNKLKNLAIKIGSKVGLSKKKLEELSMLATLHDIGKVAILDSILNKKQTLTQREWEIIKRHPEIGYRIALSSNQLSSIAEYILTIHEHWDGGGYPQGLKGKNIPLVSRIISLVDAYMVMLEGRPYKNPLSKKEAINEILKCSGTQFDPELVKDFLAVISSPAK